VALAESEALRASEPAPPHASNHYGKPLTVAVADGALMITIGVETLAHATAFADWSNPYDEQKGDYIRTFAIVDPLQFAKDIRAAMLSEREDGSSLLTDFLDKSSKAAIEDGSTGLDDKDHEIKHGEFADAETWSRAAALRGEASPPPAPVDRDDIQAQLDTIGSDFTQSFDARVWAAAFVKHVTLRPTIATDEATMIGWFANAIMRGYDEHARREAERARPAPGGGDA
jgi:hypothetical protein